MWHYTKDGLEFRIGHSPDRLPSQVRTWLIGPAGSGISVNAAADLLALDGRFSRVIASLTQQVDQAQRRVHKLRSEREDAAGTWWSTSARRRRDDVDRILADANTLHEDALSSLNEAWVLQRLLRRFVIELDAPYGLLAEAARGWRRSPAVPGSVTVFDDESTFLAADSRRGDGARGFTRVMGDEFGEQWRRDGDEDDIDPLDRAGPWTVGYLPRTAEIYAVRRSGYLPGQVWLLGSRFEDVAQAHTLLGSIEWRMREPNSLILAAESVHAVRSLPASGQLYPPAPRTHQAQAAARRGNNDSAATDDLTRSALGAEGES
ncbi:hypothetical protein L3Q67_25710 [Saccharothrix sp. AJ9571]|nr:hypothetical protein L3Q67_25710 [Saccharothrix sp. AJ9571]